MEQVDSGERLFSNAQAQWNQIINEEYSSANMKRRATLRVNIYHWKYK